MGEIKIHRTTIADPEANVYYFITDDIYKRIKAGPLMKYVVFERGSGYLKGHTIDYGNDIFKINGHKFCINNFKVEDTVDERIFDEGEDEDMKRMEHGVYFDEKDKYHNFKFYVWNDAKRSKHDNKFSKYFVEHNSYLYKYDAEIGELTTYRPNLVPFKEWIEVSKEDCLDYESCCERIIAGNFSPDRNIKEYCITANRFYDDEPVVMKTKVNPITHDDCVDWVSAFDEENFSKFSSYDDALDFIRNHPGFFNSHIVYNVKVIEVDNLPKVEEGENYEFEDGKKLKDSLKENIELVFYKTKDEPDFTWIFDKTDNRWFGYNGLAHKLTIVITDCVPAAHKLEEISMSKYVAESIKKEAKRLLNDEKSFFGKSASKSKEKKMTATMKKVKVVPKSEKYTRNDIEQALNEAYDDYGYVLDFIKEDDNYVYIYLKEKEIN